MKVSHRNVWLNRLLRNRLSRGLLRNMLVGGLISTFLMSVAHATEEFLIPFPEDHTLSFLAGISSDTSCGPGDSFGPPNPDEPVNTITDFVVRVTNTVIVVDHWEDGYEGDLNAISEGAASASATTRVYGDGNISNGALPGVTTNAGDVLTQGQVVVFEESINTATQLGDIEVVGQPITGGGTRTTDGVDGGDRIFATETINVTRAQWAGTYDINDLANSQSGTLFAGAFELFPTSQWGDSFTMPVGEDTAPIEFQWTGVTIMAANDGTSVSVDANADGDFTDPGDINAQTINRGQTIEVAGRNDIGGVATGGLSAGARIFSSDIVQVNIITGQECSNYASRWFTLFPDALLGNVYYEPVSTPAGDATVIHLYNPSSNPITVNWETTAGLQTPIIIPGQTTTPQTIPAGTGAKFFTGNSSTFGALTVVDEGDTAHDWGHASTSDRLMGNIVQVGFAEGDDPSQDDEYFPASVGDGLVNWTRYDGTFADTTVIESSGTLNGSGTDTQIDLAGNTGTDFGLIHQGFIKLEEVGTYTFATTSDDGSRLFIDGTQVVLNDANQAPTQLTGTINITEPGWYPIQVEFRQGIGGLALSAQIQAPSAGALADIPSSILSTFAPIIGENDAPVWLIADNPTDLSDTQFEICVDVSGDGGPNTDPNTGRLYDYTFTLDRLDSARLYDGGRATANDVPAHIDGDQSGMLVFVCDGSDAILAAAWGQDPSTASGASPAVDVGTTVRSISADVAFLGDTVFEDVNSNGVRDPGERGIQNVTVILTPPASVNLGQGPGQPLTTQTDFNGSYLFAGLVNGLYRVEVIPPSGFTQTADPDASNGDPVVLDNVSRPTIADANGRLDQDFGYNNDVPVGDVGDFIYNDLNGNGIQEVGETGIPDIDVELCFLTDSVDTVATDDFSAQAYNNNAAQWAGDWVELNDDGSATTAINTDQGILVTAGGELSLRGNSNGPSLTRQIDMSAYVTGTLNFDWRGAGTVADYEASDEVFVEISLDGTNFTTLTTIEGQVIAGTTGSDSVPVSFLNSATVFVRFRVRAGNFFGANENLFLDNITVTGDTTTTTCQTETTDGSGGYLFTGLASGNYTVTVLNPPAGATNSDDPGGDGDSTNQFTLFASGGNLEQDFGYFTPAQVIGHVYFDTNGNGVQDLGEANIPNLNVEITDSLGNLQIVTTDANGDYLASVPPGTTQVKIDETDPDYPTGFAQTDGADPTTVTAVADATVDAGDDGYYQGNVIGDTVYSEEDGTPGAQGPSDPGLPNVAVTLTPPAGVDIGSGAGVAISTTTDTNGNYSFVGLPDGTYTVMVAQPGGSTQTEDPDGGNDNISVVTVSGGITDNDQDFGYQNNVVAGVIGDRVYTDTNGNGVQDGSEVGIAGIVVQICGDLDNNNATANTCRTETTDADGDYLFGDLLSADGGTADPADTALPATDGAELYTVTILNPPAGQLNSQDPDGGLPNFSQLTLSTAGGNLDQDFGYYQPGTVSGHLYIDSNGNGTQDIGEPDLVNVDVIITDSNGNQQTVTSDINGDYTAQVPPGSTTANVDETDPQYPASHIQTEGADPTTVTAVAGTDVDLGIDGYAPAARLGDFIFFDSATGGTTGVYDAGIDTGIPNVTVTLTPPAGVDIGAGPGNPISTTTDVNGNYGFGSLPAGTYTINVTQPNNTNATVDPNEVGTCSTCDNSSTVTLAVAESNLAQDFGYQTTTTPGICPIGVVTFDEYAPASANSTTIFNSEYATGGADNTSSPLGAGYGFTVSATGGGTDLVTAYNTDMGTNGNDPDLEFSDTGNALIVQEAASSGTPNTGGVGEGGWLPDDAVGGTLTFDFERPLTEFSATLVDFENATNALVFTNTSTGVSVTVTQADFGDDGLGTTGAFEQNPANCPALGNNVVCVMDNSITAAELAAFGGVALQNFDRVQYAMTGSGAIDDLNFEFDCAFGTIGDRIFEDLNANGVQDVGELGLAGIVVQICGDLDDNNSTAQTCRTETTDADGDYLFGDGFAGDGSTPDAADIGVPGTTGTEDYTITVTNPPAGAINTADPDGGTASVAQLTLPSGISNLDQDFGYAISGNITGNVSQDTDGDGAGDLNLPGVIVELYTDPNGDGDPSDGVRFASTATNAGGDYSFLNVPVGDYVLVEVDPAGLSSLLDGDTSPDIGGDAANANTNDNFIPVGLTGETDADNNFVDVATASVAGKVWLDEDLDGILDTEEAGLTQVTVQLILGGVVVDTITTDANGNYLFPDVLPGAYTVNVLDTTLPGGLTNTAGVGGIDPKPVTVESGDKIRDVNFGYVPTANTGAIGDRVWSDADGDGVQDPGEAGIDNVSLSLVDAAGNTIATTTSNADGDYLFTNVPFADDYTVRISPSDAALAGYSPTSGPQSEGGYVSNPVSLDLALTVVTDLDFGFDSPASNTVRDTIWIDQNGDGVLDGGEPLIAGVTVDILNSLGEVVATTISDANGVVEFTGLPDGNYTLRVTDIDGKLDGLTGTTDEGVARVSDSVSVTGGITVTDTSFGYNNSGLIAGTVYSDADSSSDQEGGEPGLAAVTVTLREDADNNGSFETVVATVTTNPDGSYAFDGLPAGSYQVTVTSPTGLQTEDPQGAVDNIAAITLGVGESSTGNDFGYFDNTLNPISGTVFLDTDKDGIEEAGELGIPDISLQLSLAEVTVIDGFLDLDNDGDIDSDDTGTYLGIDVIDGALDINQSGSITGLDNGEVNGVSVFNGRLDINQSNTVTNTDDGVLPSVNLAQTTTDANGDYSFTGLPDGRYTVSVTDNAALLAGYDITSGLDTLSATVAGAPVTDVDFGYIREEATASISGELWIDEDSDGSADDDEFNLTEIDVHLCRAPAQVLSFERYDGSFTLTAQIASGTLDAANSGTRNEFSLLPGETTNYGYIYNGFIFLNETGDYRFRTASDDGSVLSIDGVQLVDNDGNHGDVTVTSVVTPLEAGWHEIDVLYFQGTAGSSFTVSYETPSSGGFIAIPAASMSENGACNPTNPNYVATTSTDAVGGYIFSDLPPGQYVVEADPSDPDLPPGLDLTVQPAPVGLSEGEDVRNVDIGYEPDDLSGVLSGFVWTDVNSDGIYDEGEAPIAGVTITVNDFNARTPALPFGPVVGTAVSKADGTWIISDITGSDLTDGLIVRYTAGDVPAGLNSAQPTNMPLGDVEYLPVDLATDPDNNISYLDFAFPPEVSTLLGSIEGTIYSDADQDMDYAAASDGELRDVTVSLVNSSGVIISTVETDANGFYQFAGLPDGMYSVVVTDLANITKDLNPLELISNPITIDTSVPANTGNYIYTEQDAGYVSDTDLFSIGNRFFFDTNNNGEVDIDEPGIEGVTVQCWLDADFSETPDNATIDSADVVPQPGVDNLIRTVKTDENGEYYCTSLPAGQYIVRVVDAGAFDEGTDGADVIGNAGDNFAKNWSYALTLSDSAPNFAADFGVVGSNSLSGTIVIEDEDLVEPILADGDQVVLSTELDGTPGGVSPDSPAANVPVFLFVEQDGVFVKLLETVTDANGSYAFTNLPDGNYKVEVKPNGSPIDGFGQTGDPDLVEDLNGNGTEDLVCDSPTDALCDDESPAYSLSGGADQDNVNFAYQRDFTTTPVTMNFFKATGNGGVVDFVWETTNEVGHAGFQLYARGADGWELISDLIVGEEGDSLKARTYNYRAATDATWFALVSVSTQEEVTPHGPFRLNQEYGQNMIKPEAFDWNAVDIDKPTIDDVSESVNQRLQRLLNADPSLTQ